MSGNRQAAVAMRDDLIAESKKHYVPSFSIAVVCAGLGDPDGMMAWLSNAFDHRESALLSLAIDPMFDSVRADPRFSSLIRRIGFVPSP
jgi:hypothetical protein